MVFNMDETFISVKDGKLLVVCPRDSKAAVTTEKVLPGGYHMTLISFVCADGSGIQPNTVILPNDNLPREHSELLCRYNCSGSENGWISTAIWESWVEECFIPEVQARRARFNLPPNEKALLFADGHASRLSETAVALLTAANIQLVTLPAHCSHILQPLDCGIFNIFKLRLRAFKNQGFIPLDQGIPAYRRALLFYAIGACHEAFSPITIMKAWATTGLFPWTPNRVLDDEARVSNVEFVPPKPSKLTAVQKISGKVVTSKISEQMRIEKEVENLDKRLKRALRERSKYVKTLQKAIVKLNKIVPEALPIPKHVSDWDELSACSDSGDDGHAPEPAQDMQN